MTVIIPHPTEELIFTKLQKQVISELFEEGRILIAEKPMWIPVNPMNPVIECEQSERIEITETSEDDGSDEGVFDDSGFDTALPTQPLVVDGIEISEEEVFLPVEIKTKTVMQVSKLTLVRLHSGRKFTDDDRQKLNTIKQPVKQLKVFRLGVEKELSSVSKCISKSKWVKKK